MPPETDKAGTGVIGENATEADLPNPVVGEASVNLEPEPEPEREDESVDILSPDAQAALEAQEPEPTEPEGEEEEVPAISDELWERAVEAGYEEEDRESFASPEALERTLALLDKQTAEEGREAKVEEPTVEPFKLEFEGDDYPEPEVLHRELGRLVERFNAQAETLAALVVQNDKYIADAEQARYDAHLDGLSDEWKDIVAKPKARSAIKEEADALAAGYEARGKKVPDEQTLWERARLGLYGNDIKTRTRKQIASTLRDKAGKFTARPNSRGDEAVSGEEKAIRRVREWQEANRANFDPSEVAID
jgi:hypothetical protein